MATRTQSRQSTTRSAAHQSVFTLAEGTGPLVGAAIAGAAIGFAANFGRKAFIQGLEARAGDWDEMLAAEHDEALAIFDKMLATDESQTFKRRMLLTKLAHALDKHTHQEEMVVYPALREVNEAADADHLESEHGYIKTFIYHLNEMGADAPNWLEKVREFRQLVHQHAVMEEEQVFPRFKRSMSGDENDRITSLVNRDGFRMT